jgi:hypothetical protein
MRAASCGRSSGSILSVFRTMFFRATHRPQPHSHRCLSSALLAALVLTLGALWSPHAAAQEVGERVRVETTDGSRFVGEVVSVTEATITLLLSSGSEVELERASVQRLRTLERLGDQFVVEDPNRTRLFFAPTARPLERGEGYFVAYYVLLPFVAVGVTDRVAMAGGMSILPGLSLSDQLFYVAPKVTFYDRANRSLAAGVLYGGVPGVGGGGLAFGSATFGPSSRAVTLGAGVGFSSEGRSSPALVFGGEIQLSNSLKLITENYLTTSSLDDDYCDDFYNDCDSSFSDRLLLSGGVRFFGDRLAGDLAFLVFPSLIEDAETFVYIPWLSFAYNFGD